VPKTVATLKPSQKETCHWPASHCTWFWHEIVRYTWVCLLCLAFNWFWPILSQSEAIRTRLLYARHEDITTLRTYDPPQWHTDHMIRAYTAQPIQTAVCSSHPASRSAQFLHKYVCTAKQRGTSCRRVQAVPRGCGRAGNGGGRHKHSCRGVRGIWLVHWSHRARGLFPKLYWYEATPYEVSSRFSLLFRAACWHGIYICLSYDIFGGHTHSLVQYCCIIQLLRRKFEKTFLLFLSQKVLKNTARGARFLLDFSIYLILAQMDQVYLILAVALLKN